MDILIFEWMAGGGLLRDDTFPGRENPMFREGWAMLESIGSDLTSAGHNVHLPVDFRMPGEFLRDLPFRLYPVHDFNNLPPALARMASRSDAVLAIAPELDGRLVTALDWITGHCDRILSPSGKIVQIGSSKTATQLWLESAGVQQPCRILPAQPVVIKPDDGAGSEGILVATSPEEIPQVVRDQPEKWRTEPFLPGITVSISAIGGPAGNFIFPPTEQVFDGNSFSESVSNLALAGSGWPGPWAGFNFPIETGLAARASKLCARALDSLPKFSGYLGMDMVLAETEEADDRIVDLNPRMTSSWVGLRQLYSTNLAGFMVDHALGVACELPVQKRNALRFRLDTI